MSDLVFLIVFLGSLLIAGASFIMGVTFVIAEEWKYATLAFAISALALLANLILTPYKVDAP